MLSIQTKKIALQPNLYFKILILDRLKRDWWSYLVVVAGIVLSFWIGRWVGIVSVIAWILYFGFWMLQFYAVRYLPEAGPLFQTTSYNISGKNIVAMVSSKQGFTIEWKAIKKVKQIGEDYILFISRSQFVYIPKVAFSTDADKNVFKLMLQKRTS